jgi:hypothetical protein
MNSVNRPQTYFEVVSEGIPLPPTKNTGIMLSSAPLHLLRKYASAKPVRRPLPRAQEKK